MATGGMRVLITLPIMLAAFIFGLAQLINQVDGAMPYIGTQPDQVVSMFLSALNRGDTDAAKLWYKREIFDDDLGTLGGQLQENFGPVVMSSTQIGEITPDHAMVWSDTATSLSHRYIINWSLEREGDQWVISDFGTLRDMLADWHGL